MIIYKIGGEQYPGMAACPTRAIYSYNTETHCTTYLFSSMKSIDEILLEIKRHKRKHYNNEECSVEYSEIHTQTFGI